MRDRFVMSCVWFFCLGGLGIFFPFYALYLHDDAIGHGHPLPAEQQ